jgi:hypothetical protein
LHVSLFIQIVVTQGLSFIHIVEVPDSLLLMVFAGGVAAVAAANVPPTTSAAAVKIRTIARVRVLFIRHQALRWFYIFDLRKFILMYLR